MSNIPFQCLVGHANENILECSVTLMWLQAQSLYEDHLNTNEEAATDV